MVPGLIYALAKTENVVQVQRPEYSLIQQQEQRQRVTEQRKSVTERHNMKCMANCKVLVVKCLTFKIRLKFEEQKDKWTNTGQL